MQIDFEKYAELLPFDDKVIIKKNEKRQDKIDGIIMPEMSMEDTQSGIVVAVGIGLRDFNKTEDKTLLLENNKSIQTGNRLPMMCKTGDTVVYSKVTGQKFRFEGEDLIVQRESDLISIINK